VVACVLLLEEDRQDIQRSVVETIVLLLIGDWLVAH